MAFLLFAMTPTQNPDWIVAAIVGAASSVLTILTMRITAKDKERDADEHTRSQLSNALSRIETLERDCSRLYKKVFGD